MQQNGGVEIPMYGLGSGRYSWQLSSGPDKQTIHITATLFVLLKFYDIQLRHKTT